MTAQESSTGTKKVRTSYVQFRAHDQYTTLYAGDDEVNRDENHKFIVQKSVATSVSRTIKDMFDGRTPLDLITYSKQKGDLKKQHRMQRGYNLSSTCTPEKPG